MPHSYTSLAKHNIEGRGIVFVVPSPINFVPGKSRKSLLGRATIDGERYDVRNVECPCGMNGVSKGKPIGLVVKPVVPFLTKLASYWPNL